VDQSHRGCGMAKHRRVRLDRWQCGGAVDCSRGDVDVWWIRATTGVEWLSVGAADRSHDDASAQRIGVAVMRRRGGSEPR
jgi:hypothetical protein